MTDPAATLPPALSVVVPSVNGWDDLERCLAALSRQDVPLEVLVPERCGDAVRERIAAAHPDVIVIAVPPSCTIPMMRAIAFDRAGQMYVSSRYDGTVYRVAPNGTMSAYAEGMGVATGLAFDREENLYVGDRSGTIFKINRERQIFVFATLEPSVSAYHLAFSPTGDLFVTGPTTSSTE